MPVNLQNQAALVIGASSGIGRATAVLLAREGVGVMAAARRQDCLRDLEAELTAEGRAIAHCTADVSSAPDLDRAAAAARERFGRLDILVYATGTNTPDRSFRRMTTQLWDEVLRVNLSGAYYATQAVLPAMREAGSGHLIYISSISAMVPDVSGGAYQAAKRGLVGLAHAVRVEEKDNGIRTCVVCPGLVDTEMLKLRPYKTPQELVAKALQPIDVAEVVVSIARLHPRVSVPELQVLPSKI